MKSRIRQQTGSRRRSANKKVNKDMDVKSVKRKFKDKHFAAGCDRAVIAKGAELLAGSLISSSGRYSRRCSQCLIRMYLMSRTE